MDDHALDLANAASGRAAGRAGVQRFRSTRLGGQARVEIEDDDRDDD